MIVGLIGKKRSGKDTFAATLVAERGFTRYAFADPLKEAALALDPLVRFEADEVYLGGDSWTPSVERLSTVVERLGWEQAKEVREVRRTLQAMGVGIRELDANFWLRLTLDRALANEGPVVITDVRFPNEAESIVAHGGMIVRVFRPGLTHDDTHVSETALDGYPDDLTVWNSGSVEALAELARGLDF